MVKYVEHGLFFTGLHTIINTGTLITGPQLMPTQENPSPLCTTLPCHTLATIKPCLPNNPWTFPSFLARHSNFKIPNFNKIFLLSPNKNKTLVDFLPSNNKVLTSYIKINHFKKQNFPLSFLLTSTKYTQRFWPWSTRQATPMH